ncbi:MAG: hypothetical protein K0S29_914 [Gammaproteobacteria bacterium]|jgi:hypothetical protein|nr:hypothetical protein [Gammaproteobacteria bacterium]
MAIGQYQEAIVKLEQADKDFPGLAIAIPIYRGKILAKLDEQSEFNQFTKTERPKNHHCSPELK